MSTKNDSGKVPLHRGLLGMFPRACLAVARASAIGAEKYGWDNWQTVEDGIQRYRDAAARHAAAEAMGEAFDEDTGLPHAALVAWNSLAVLELALTEQEHWLDAVCKAVEQARQEERSEGAREP